MRGVRPVSVFVVVIMFVGTGLFVAMPVSAQVTETKLTASDGAADDHFGLSVSLSGDTAVVGAWNDGAGSAYVFVRSKTTWTEQAKLTASDGAAFDRFGRAVAIDGDTAVVGASWDGSAYVFVRSGATWAEQAKLVASDAAGDHFGNSVSLSGDTAVVGAPHDDDAGSESGSAYVFVRSGTTWTEEAKLTASDAAAGDWFGFSVSLSGDTAVVGAWRDDDARTDSGSAYVFVRSGRGWAEKAKLVASDPAFGDSFGTSVSLSGDTAVVGAPHDGGAGSAYVFVRSGTAWAEKAKLVASDGATGDSFGWSVSLSGDTAVVGAPHDGDAGFESGSAYVFPVSVTPGPNTPPVASFSVTPLSGDVSTTFTADASSSSDAEDSLGALQVRWDWEDDGAWDTTWSNEKTAEHQYASPGTYTIRLQVRDTGELTDTTTGQVDVASAPADTTNPTITISSPADGATLTSTSVTVTGTASDDVAVEKVELSTDGTNWVPATGTASWSGTLTLIEGQNTIYARATDTSGNTATVSIAVTVATEPETPPPGFVSPTVIVVAGSVVGAVIVAIAALLVFRSRRRRKGEG